MTTFLMEYNGQQAEVESGYAYTLEDGNDYYLDDSGNWTAIADLAAQQPTEQQVFEAGYEAAVADGYTLQADYAQQLEEQQAEEEQQASIQAYADKLDSRYEQARARGDAGAMFSAAAELGSMGYITARQADQDVAAEGVKAAKAARRQELKAEQQKRADREAEIRAGVIRDDEGHKVARSFVVTDELVQAAHGG